MSTGSAGDGKNRLKRNFFTIVTGRTFIIAILLIAQLVLLMIGLERFGNFFHMSGTVITALMLIYVVNTRSDPTVKLTWCFVIALVPVLGIPLYFYIRTDLGHRTVKAAIYRSIEETAPLFPKNDDIQAEITASDPDSGALAQYLRSTAGFPAYRDQGTEYFPLGEDKFTAMLRELETAKEFIFMEYFIVAPGQMWDGILDVLARKVKEGVEVRFMYDGTCAFADVPYSYPKQMEALGIKCKMFAPVRPLVSTHYNNRDHRKILVIDGRTAFTGGVNLADEYINQKVRFGHWKDTAVLIRGEAVRSFTLMFLQMWNSSERVGGCCYDRYLPDPNALPESASEADVTSGTPDAPEAPETGGYVIPYGDSPMDDERVGEMVYLGMINVARRYVYIMSPYLILDSEALTALTFAAKRGVDVRLILPHIPDKKYAFWLAKSHYAELMAAGVRIYEYTPGFVHAKVVLSDDTRAVVGTVNFDYRSFYHHFEDAALLLDVPAIRDIIRDFENTFGLSREVTMSDVRHEKLHVRLIGGLLKIVAPLM